MSDNITIRGFVATSPSTNTLPSGTALTNFRVASTPRWYDSNQQVWREGNTNWFTVNAFRNLAENASRSIFVGQPVIVTGRINIKQWQNDDGKKGTSVEIDATAIGHDLSLGTSSFNRAVSNAEQRPATSSAQQAQGVATEEFSNTTSGVEQRPSSSESSFQNSEESSQNEPDSPLVDHSLAENKEFLAMT